MLLFCSSLSRTWYIKVDGSGDAPTIQAGVDSSAAGDTVLVGPGTYYVNIIWTKEGLTIIGEEGPLETLLRPIIPSEDSGFALESNTELKGFWTQSSLYSSISLTNCDNVKITGNIIQSSSALTGIIASESFAEIANNLFFGTGAGIYIDSHGPYFYYIYNNIILNDVVCGGINDLFPYCNFAGPEPWSCPLGEISGLDPQFCGLEDSGNYFLQEDSPCAPDNSGGCGLIGPLPVGCGTVATEQKSWGEIKSIYKK